MTAIRPLHFVFALSMVAACHGGALPIPGPGPGPDLGPKADLASEAPPDLPGVDLLAVWGTDPQNVFFAGTKGTLLHLQDGHYTKVAGIPAVTWRGVAGTAWSVVVVGDGGTVLRSLDAGASWQVAPTGVTEDLNAVAADGDRVWVAGDAGTLLASLDGGASFTRVAAPTTEDLRGVTLLANPAFLEPYVVGAGGTTLRGDTTADPPKFVLATLPSGHDVNGAWFRVPSSLFIATAHPSVESGAPRILQTDQWPDWKVACNFAGAVLHGIGGNDAGDIYAVGEYGSSGRGMYLYRAGTGCKSSATLPRPLRGVWVKGADAYLVGDGGTILHIQGTPSL